MRISRFQKSVLEDYIQKRRTKKAIALDAGISVKAVNDILKRYESAYLRKAPLIIRNAAMCLKCGDEIESTHTHDFKSCSCGNIFVDGGYDYIRRGAKDISQIKELSE